MMDPMPWWNGPLLLIVGLAAGTLNVLAGGGSFLTLPVLIFLGLPAGIANGTNRVGILLQNVAAVWSFKRHGVTERWAWLRAAVPAMLGAVLGTGLALVVGDTAFERILAFLMVVLTLWTLWGPRPQPKEADPATASAPPSRPGLLAGGFFLAGIYGGFVQAGVGFLVLGVTSAAGLDLVRGNAVKVLSILCLTGFSLGIFAWQGRVEWIPGLWLAGGTILGGMLGARLTVLKGHQWVQRFVTLMVIVFAIKLWFD